MTGDLFQHDGSRKYLTQDERQAFLTAAAQFPHTVRSFCSVLAYTGCRLAEALALTADRVDLTTSRLTFETLKKRKRGIYRAVPVPLLVVIDVGTRTLAMAQRVVHQVAQVLAPGCLPLCLTDGLKDYGTALRRHFGTWTQPERRQDKGPRPKPRWMPLPQLLYTQVVKTVRRRRLVAVQHRVVFGTIEALNQVLVPLGWQINTAFVERLNLTIRQHVAAVGRRVTTLCKGEEGLRQQLALYQTYYNFCLPHARVRQPLPQPMPTNGTGSAKQWRPCTPAMAAGLTDHVWSVPLSGAAVAAASGGMSTRGGKRHGEVA